MDDAAAEPNLKRIAVIIGALLLVAGVLLLVSGGGGDRASSDVPRGTMDGILVSATAQEIVLQRQDDGETVRFGVRQSDLRNLDLFHLETHARDRLPSRVHYERGDGALFAVRVDDL